MDILKQTSLYPESITDFADNFLVDTPKILGNVWLLHYSESSREDIICRVSRNSVESSSCISLSLPSLTPLVQSISGSRIFKAIRNSFKTEVLIAYIYQKTYLCLKYENGAFEALFVYPELNLCIERASRQVVQERKRKSSNVSLFYPPKKKICRPTSPDMFTEMTVRPLKKTRGQRIQIDKNPTTLLETNMSGKAGLEQISLNSVLYDSKQRGSLNLGRDVKEVLIRICQLELKNETTRRKENMATLSEKWVDTTRLLNEMLENEATISQNCGYLRILKQFLKSAHALCALQELKPIKKEVIMNYVGNIFRRICPKQIFGSNRALKQFLSSVNVLVNAGKHQTILLNRFQCFQDLQWMNEIELPIRSTFCLKLAKFLVVNVILKIVKNIFFVTESGTSGYELFYYTKSAMESISRKHINGLVARGNIVPINYSTILDENLSLAKVRCLPKTPDSGEVRIITMVPKTQMSTCDDQFFFVKLWLEWAVHKYGTGIRPYPHEPRLCKSWQDIATMRDGSSKLYFVKADISDAFGSINHLKLFQILDNIISKGNVIRQSVNVVEWCMKRGQIIKKSRLSMACDVKPNRILVSRIVSYQLIDSLQLKDVIHRMMTKQTLYFYGKYYKVCLGLCQGGAGKLSPILSDLYYSFIDCQEFSCFNNDIDSLLLRAVDDYILLTTDKSKAERFFMIIQQGVPQFNTQFNRKKVLTNLYDDNIRAFPYLGLIFDVENLTVQPDLRKLLTEKLIFSIKCGNLFGEPHFRINNFFKKKILNMTALKILKIVFDRIDDAESLVAQIFAAQIRRVLYLAIFLSVDSEVLLQVLNKSVCKISRVIRRLTNSVKLEEIDLNQIYWVKVFEIFSEKIGKFPGLMSKIKMKINSLN